MKGVETKKKPIKNSEDSFPYFKLKDESTNTTIYYSWHRRNEVNTFSEAMPPGYIIIRNILSVKRIIPTINPVKYVWKMVGIMFDSLLSTTENLIIRN